MEFEYLISNKRFKVDIQKKNDIYEIKINDEIIIIQPIHCQTNLLTFKKDESYQKVFFAKDNSTQYIVVDGHQYRIEDLYRSEQQAISKDHLLVESESEVCAPMPGKILKIFVKVGEKIELKQNLVIVEAMKMENNITSSMKGIVKKINFKEGDLVDTGQPIIELEPITE